MKRGGIVAVGFALVIVAILAIPFAVPIISAQTSPRLSAQWPAADQLVEGADYRIGWSSAALDTVTVTASGHRTSITGRDRGRFSIILADRVPSDSGDIGFTLPFIDSARFVLTVSGYDSRGRLVASDSKRYHFRPAILADRKDDGIYIDLHDEHTQRLYVLRDNRVAKVYLTSGAPRNRIYPLDSHPDVAHDHEGVFYVQAKYPLWHSRLFDADMTWAMQYWNGHFIHGTTSEFYAALGTAASHGCDRLTDDQAKELYNMTPVGTRVEIVAHLPSDDHPLPRLALF